MVMVMVMVMVVMVMVVVMVVVMYLSLGDGCDVVGGDVGFKWQFRCPHINQPITHAASTVKIADPIS